MKTGTYREMERREDIRLEKTLPVKFDFPDQPQSARGFEALSRNIGLGGIFIETDLPQDEKFELDKDAILNLDIELLGQAKRIKPRGQIAWVSKKSRTPHKKRSGFGISFIQISGEEKRAISLFISKEMMAQSERVEKEIPAILREQKLTDRQRRNLQILDIIRKNRLISRAEISKQSDINIVTVSNYVDTYLKKGLVFERGLDISTGGRRPELIEINPDYGYMIGVDLGPAHKQSALLRVVATDFTAQMVAQEQEKRADDNIEQAQDTLKGLIAQVMASNQIERKKIRGIGIGIAGIMDKFGGTVRNPFTGDTIANYVTIKKELEDEFGLPVFIESSPACALFAEKWNGARSEVKEADNLIYLFSLQQCAIMIKGELCTGSSKSAGHLNLNFPRNRNNNNNEQSDFCWLDPNCDCVLRVSPKDLEMVAEQKEDLIACGTKLGVKIAYLVNIFNPQVVIIGNNFSLLGDTFLDVLRRTVSRWAFREGANIVRIIPASSGEESTALGAASLVIESAFANI